MRFYHMLLILALLPIVMGATTEISLKTNEEYTGQYAIRNTGDDALSDCRARWQGDFAGQEWVQVLPAKFDMAPGALQQLSVIITKPPVGFYSDVLQVACDRSVAGVFVGRYDIIAPDNEPVYSMTVKIAGEGEGYTIQPVAEFKFLTNPGDIETAKFTIVNTGTVDLPVNITSDDPLIIFTPSYTVVGINNRVDIKVQYVTQKNFSSFKKIIMMRIGSYDEPFTISGQLEKDAAGAPAFASILTDKIAVGTREIPGWLILVVLVGAMYLVIKGRKEK
jgi:hypothetical protein